MVILNQISILMFPSTTEESTTAMSGFGKTIRSAEILGAQSWCHLRWASLSENGAYEQPTYTSEQRLESITTHENDNSRPQT